MNQHLLLFTFGPIQGFIAQARKTADLYAGSRILTELAEAAIAKVNAPHEVLFPSTQFRGSLTNRIVVKVNGTPEDTKELGQTLVDTAQSRWLDIAQQSMRVDHFKIPEAQNQINHQLETYWIAVPLGADYLEAYKKLNGYVASDKNQREWAVELNEAPGRKCSLDGVRNALFYGVDKTGNASVARRVVSAAKAVDDKSLQVNEALSAVGFVKRKYGQAHPFPSTATIALMHVLEKSGIKMNVEVIKENDQLYFEENLTDKYLTKLGEPTSALDQAKAEYASWKQRVKDAGLKTTPYYALLHFDGDKMGQWFSGDFLPEKPRLLEFHKQFTILLGEFAEKAKAYLDETKQGRGRTVYAGGDDFVGFVNLYALFDVLHQLRAMFDTLVYEQLRKDFGLTNPITFSAGVAIAHYKQPLGMVLDMARRMEKKAKNHSTAKNAWAIGLMVRAGATDELVMPWKHEDIYTPADIETFIKSINQEELSTTFISNIEAMERHYGGWPERPEYIRETRSCFFQRSLPSSKTPTPLTTEDLDRMVESLPGTHDQQRLLNVIEFLSRHIHYPIDTPVPHE